MFCGGNSLVLSVIDGLWDWELAYNPGVAFSTFASMTGQTGMQVILSLIALLALAGITVLAMRTSSAWGVMEASIGNLVDRVHDGAVTDFVRWRIHEHAWPIFNLADAALLMQDVGSEPREALDLISEVEVEILLDPLTMRRSEDLVQKLLRRRWCKRIVFGFNHLPIYAKHRRPSYYDVQV